MLGLLLEKALSNWQAYCYDTIRQINVRSKADEMASLI